MFDLDIRSRQPIYEQLVGKFKELIISEVLKPDEQLPSVRVLAGQLTINPNTIQKAYRELERQGYIYSIPGKGNFVARVTGGKNTEKLARLKEKLVDILSEAIYLGMEKEEIVKIISEVDTMVKGGKKVIAAKNIYKTFDDLTALDGVSINVKQGSIYGLVGSNGAGKTTLLKILAGFYRQDFAK